MISRKLVLVLGAGASRTYGFPSGWELTKSMFDTESNPDQNFYQKLLGCNFPGEMIHKFRRELKYSAAQSVDAFLEHRTDFLEIGKAAIAYRLIPHEQIPVLFKEDADNWYRYLFGKLNSSFELFQENQIAVLTFNYDRSLEQFLLTALMNKYQKSCEDCAAALQSIPIVHLHGKLWDLPGMGKDEFAYNADHSDQRVLNGAKGIRIIHEDQPTEEFELAGRIIDSAERICFLGFGYDKTNLSRLIRSTKNREQQIFGSAIGLTSQEAQNVEYLLRELGFQAIHGIRSYWHLTSTLQFLREACPFDWD
ncbi:MAG: hypothetical protein EXQ56_11770 [Acidobacteria bacterium]|nr:hypothetical protein [Acidobacteriota bacterium]